MSRILFLSQLLPYPPDNGPKMRSYYVLRHLAKHHQVVLAAFTRPDDPPEAVAHLETFCEAVHTVPIRRSLGSNLKALAASLLTRQSFVIRRDSVPAMTRLVRGLLQKEHFDQVHADQLWMAQYALMAERGKRKGRAGKEPPPQTPRLVLDEHNACYQIFQRLAKGERNPLKRALYEYEWRALYAYEAQTCARFDHVVTVTYPDKMLLKNMASESGRWNASGRLPRFTNIPICVDTASVEPVCPQPGAMDVLNMGTMFFLPNIEGVLWFANEVWPQVAARVPNASFSIVGKNPPQEIKDLEDASSRTFSAPTTRPLPRIYVTGYVSDPKPYLERAAVFIVPLLSGGGMRVKIIDAWRWGLPVVSTTVGAEGIQYRDRENILIADEAGAFAQAVIQVLCQPEYARMLRENGRKWVEKHYDWQKIYEAWETIYSDGHQN